MTLIRHTTALAAAFGLLAMLATPADAAMHHRRHRHHARVSHAKYQFHKPAPHNLHAALRTAIG